MVILKEMNYIVLRSRGRTALSVCIAALLSMKTEKQRKLIVRIGAAILAGLMILSALSAVLFS